MRKIIIFLLVGVMIFSLTSCVIGTGESAKKEDDVKKSENVEGELKDILEKIYETADLSDDFIEYTLGKLQTVEITEEKTEYYLGKEGIEFQEAIASEPLIMPFAYELDLIRAKEGSDVEKLKNEIKENVDPAKWICVGIDPEKVIVDNIGDLIIVIMSEDEGEALYEAFLTLKG